MLKHTEFPVNCLKLSGTTYDFSPDSFKFIIPRIRSTRHEEARYLHILSNTYVSLKRAKIGINGFRLNEEISSLLKFRKNPHVIAYYGWYLEAGLPYIFVETTDICLSQFRTLLKSKNSHYWFPEQILGHIAVIVLNLLQYLNQKGYCHGNIHRSAIHFNRNGEIKISTFEYCWKIEDIGQIEKFRDLFESESYIPPERSFEENSLDFRNDIWALGATLTVTYMDKKMGIPNLLSPGNSLHLDF